MDNAVTSKLLSQTGPDKWDLRLESRSVRGLRTGLKLGEISGQARPKAPGRGRGWQERRP